MKTRILVTIFFLSLVSGSVIAQQNMLYNHYYQNPFLYNPSYIAPSGYTELFLNYRRQWSGINGAPTTGTLNLHVPLSYRAGVAFTAFQDEAGLLKTTTGLVSFSYQIYFGKRITEINKLSFGLSAGVTNSRIDADEAGDIQDPVLGNNTSSMDGQVGVNYQYNRFKLGFAVPRIFETKVASEETFNRGGISQLDNTITTMSYDFRLSERFSFEPMVTYRTYRNLDSYYEILGTFKLSSTGWIGGAYRDGYGAFAFFGVNIKQKLKVSYAYEFATEQTDRIGAGSHEVQLSLRLGKKEFSRPQLGRKTATTTTSSAQKTAPKETSEQKPKEPAQVEEPAHDIDPVQDDPLARGLAYNEEVAKQLNENKPETNEQVVTQTESPATESVEITQAEENKIATSTSVTRLNGEDLAPGHYVVVGAFESKQNARTYAATLKRAGYPANVAFDPHKGYYLVHMDKPSADVQQAREMRDKYRQMSRYSFRDTWVLSID